MKDAADFELCVFREQLMRDIETDLDGSLIQGWVVSFNGAPWCASGDDLPCMDSPGYWCQVGAPRQAIPHSASFGQPLNKKSASTFSQAPEAGGYDGIWRHYALRFGDDGGGTSELEMFLDGRRLCTMALQSSPELTPQ
jgi:hypothetical protein